MNTRQYARAHLRAPLNRNVLIADQNFVFRATAKNISEGGLLLENLPFIPEKETVPVMVDLVKIPSFSQLSQSEIDCLIQSQFKRYIFRAEVKIVRKNVQGPTSEEVFKPSIGVQFTQLESKDKSLICGHVSTFATNVVYMLGLFQSSRLDDETVKRIKKLSILLGYSSHGNLNQLKNEIQHDYKSLQWEE